MIGSKAHDEWQESSLQTLLQPKQTRVADQHLLMLLMQRVLMQKYWQLHMGQPELTCCLACCCGP
jgi:hypothetical protein